MAATLAAALAAAALAAAPADAALAAETVLVGTLPAPLPMDPDAAAWAALPALEVLAAPQRTIRLHDRAANAALDKAGPRTLKVRAATDGQALAVLVEWPDATEDRAQPDATDRYGDGVALQLPLRFGAGQRLPYVGMGDEAQPVALLFQRATRDGVALRTAVGTGFGTPQRRDLGPLRGAMRHDAKAGTWRAVFVRPLEAGGLDLRRGLVPVTFATWDGAASERGGNKALSGWRFLRLPGQPVDEAYAAELAWGHRPGDLGDAARGRKVFQGTCTACHVAGEDREAVPGLAPDLSEIGVIATPAYLRESVLAPSAVIVPNPNPHQHQDRKDPAARPWPIDEGYTWFAVEADGKKVSGMPETAGLAPADLADLVAYLVTLGAPAPAGRKP